MSKKLDKTNYFSGPPSWSATICRGLKISVQFHKGQAAFTILEMHSSSSRNCSSHRISDNLGRALVAKFFPAGKIKTNALKYHKRDNSDIKVRELAVEMVRSLMGSVSV